MIKNYILLVLTFLCASFTINAQVNLTASGGTPIGSYPTVKDAFDAINLGTHTGIITLSIVANTTETASAVLNASGTGSASYTSISISPSGGALRTISGSLAAPLIDLNGADNVTINGLNSGGNALTISNSSATSTTNTSTIRFIGDASSNTITNTTIEGSSISTSLGTIYFSTGLLTGNDGNTISNNNIIPAGSNSPVNSIFSLGTAGLENSGNSITGNNISDYFSATLLTVGVLISTNNTAWTINNNKLFQTALRTYTTANIHKGIQITSGDGYLISGNTIGFASSNGTGVYSMAGTIATRFNAIDLGVGTTNPSSVQGNTIAAINLATSSGAATANGILCGINITSGNVNVGTITGNIIGATTGTGSLVATPTTTQGAIVGINTSSTGVINIINNQMGAWTSSSSTATVAGAVFGINVSGAASSITISNNTIGNATAENIRAGINGTTTGSSIGGGINLSSTPTLATITNNTIQNFSTYGTGTAGFVRGMWTTTSSTSTATGWIVSSNVITNLITNGTFVGIGSGLTNVVGIHMLSPAGVEISLNSISNLSNVNNTHTTNTIVAGIVTANSLSAGAGQNVNKNKIWNLSNAGIGTTQTAPPMIVGIGVRSGNAITSIVNNMISLGNAQTTNTTIVGILNNNGSSPNPTSTNIYFNSVNIEGTVSSGSLASFGYLRGDLTTTARTITVDVRNNILSNTRTGGTGQHFAISNNFGATVSLTGWPANASNYNLLHTADPNTVGHWTTALTFAGWQAAANSDLNSISGTAANFVNAAAGDLHIVFPPNSVIEGAGTDIPSVTDDFDGQTRSTLSPVDIGADAGNFSNAPTITVTPLTTTCSFSARTLTATITDPDGVPTSGIGLPVLYWRINAGAYTAATATFISGNTYSFTFGAGVSAGDVVSYYIAAQDNLGNVGTRPLAGAAGFTSNPPAASTPPTSPFTYSIAATLAGTYTVGSGGNYPTLTAAINAYNIACLNGPVVFSLTDAAYASETFPITINQNADASAVNTLTIKPAAGVTSNITGSSPTALIVLNGADFVTINGSNGSTINSVCPSVTASRDLTLTQTNTGTSSAVIWLQWYFEGATPNSAQNNNIINLNIAGNSNTTTLFGLGSGSTTISVTTLGYLNNNNSFINNNISKAQYGIFSNGQSVASKNTGTIINQNLINTLAPDNVARGGIFLGFDDGGQVRANNISEINLTSSPDVWGISLGFAVSGYLTTASTGSEVSNVLASENIIGNITNSGTFSAVGIGLVNSTVGTNVIANNLISGVKANGTSSDFAGGIVVGGGNVKVYHNTVTMTGTITGTSAGSTVSTAFAYTSSTAPTGLDIRNNIFLNNQLPNASGTTKFVAIGLGYSSTLGNYAGLISDYNDLWVSSDPNHFLGITGGVNTGTTRATLLDWQTETGRDLNSFNFNPVFNSPTALHLVAADPTNAPLLCGGVAVLPTVTDIDCETRSNVKPTIGADEVPNSITPAIAVFETSGPNDGVICNGSTVTLTASGGGTYLWSTGETTAQIFVTPSSTTIYTVTVTSGLCADATSTTITVNQGPTISFNPSAPAICPGNSVTITASGGVSYVWSTGSTSASTTVSPSSTTTYSVTATDVSGCTAVGNITVTVNPLPPAAISPTVAAICFGGNINLTASGGTSYVWSTTETTSTINVAPSSNTTYTVTVTDANLCTATASRLVTVNPLPTASISPSIAQICTGGNINLTASGGTSYEWSTTETTATINVAPASTTTYTVTVTDANTCTANASRVVTVNSPPTLSETHVEPTTCVSADGSINLTVSPGGSYTYNWATPNGSGLVNGQEDQTGLTVGGYYVTVTNTATGCTAVLLTSLIGPGGCSICPTMASLTTNPPEGVCQSAVFTITASGLTDMGVTYGINFVSSTVALADPYSGGTLIASVPNAGLSGGGTVATTSTSISTPGNYFLYAILSPVPSDPSCRPSVTTNLVVFATPNAVATPSSQTICSGATITPIVLSGAVGGTTYSWVRDNTGSVTGIAANGTGNITGSLTNTTTSPITVTFTITPSANGCTGPTTTATVLVNPTPNAVATPSTQTICSGSAITTITLSGNVAGTTYNWVRDNTVSVTGIGANGSGNISGSLTNTTNAPVTVTFTITPTANGCPGPSTTASVVVNPTPTVNAVTSVTYCPGVNTTAITFSGAVAGTVYSWTRTAAAIGLAATSGTASVPSFLTTNAGTTPLSSTFTVTPTYTNGGVTCTGASTTFTITVNPTPTVTQPTNVTGCHGSNIPAKVFAGTVAGTVFNWTNNNTSIGLGASGTGNVPAFVAVNNTGVTQVATVTVTPSYTNGGTTCTGTPRTYTITISPRPVAVCSNTTVFLNAGGTVTITANQVNGGSTGGTLSVAPSSFTCANVGNNVVTLTVTDACGFTSTCTATVKVVDNLPPVLNNVPANVSVECDAPLPPEPNVTATDNCSATITYTQTNNQSPWTQLCANNSFNVVRTWTATDPSGNKTTKTQTISVKDTKAPTFKSVPPAFLTVECDDDNDNNEEPVPVDACDATPAMILDIVYKFNPNGCPNSYVATYTWTAGDNCGNTIQYVQKLTVEDKTPPTIFCPGNITLTSSTPQVVTWPTPKADDVCDGATGVTQITGPPSGSTFGVDTKTLITYRATDECGNSSTCTFVVTIIKSGSKVGYTISGDVTDDTNHPIKGEVQLTGSVSQFADAIAGKYLFSDITKGYNLSVSAHNNTNPLNGVNTLDLVYITNHILGKKALNSPYKLLAADVNHSKSITTGDIVELRKLILHITSDFANAESWEFINSPAVFTNAANPWKDVLGYNVAINNIQENKVVNFIGYKMGDVTNDANPNGANSKIEVKTNESLKLVAENKIFDKGEEVELLVSGKDMENMKGLQFTLNYDVENLDFVAVKGEQENIGAENFGLRFLESGKVTGSIELDKQAQTDKLFTLIFKSKQRSELKNNISISSALTSAQAYTNLDETIGLELSFTQNGKDLDNTRAILYQNEPNPFENNTVIRFALPVSQEATFSIFNVEGKLIKELTEVFGKGENKVSLEKSELPASGIYYYQLKTKDFVDIKKMIFVK